MVIGVYLWNNQSQKHVLTHYKIGVLETGCIKILLFSYDAVYTVVSNNQY